MAQFNNPDNTFRTHLGNDGGQSARMIMALRKSAWDAWKPDVGFPEQYGSGYGDMNAAIIYAPKGQYQTNVSLNQASTRAQQAQRNAGKPAWLVALRTWWTGA